MINKFIYFFFLIFVSILLQSNSYANNQFNFDVTELEILENGNIIKGSKKGSIKTNDNIFITSNTFIYNKKKNIFTATGNVKFKDFNRNVEIFSNKIKIKWPNDLLFERKKICGILQETVINDEKKFLIVGIGINTNLNPKNSRFLSTSLKQITNKNIDNEKLFIMIKKNYEKLLLKANRNSFSELKKFTKKI